MRETILICDCCGKRDVSKDCSFDLDYKGDSYEEDGRTELIICTSCLVIGLKKYIKKNKCYEEDILKLLDLKKFVHK